MSRLRIEVLTGSDAGRVFESDADVIRIGRGAECELRLSGPSLSSSHVRIVGSDSGFGVADLGSASGSAVPRCGERTELEQPQSLGDGDELELGAEGGEPIRLRVSLGSEAPAPEVVATRSLQELATAHTLEPKLWSAVLRALG